MNLYLTTAIGNAVIQPNPSESLGGFISGSLLQNGQIHNLFDKIEGGRASRALVLRNDLSVVATNISIHYENRTLDPYATYMMALVALAKDQFGCYVMEKILQEDVSPVNASFLNNKNTSRALTLASLDPSVPVGIWIQRVVNSYVLEKANECNSLYSKFIEVTEVAEYSIQTVADVTDSLNQGYFVVNTTRNSYYIYYDTGAATFPESIPKGHTVIRIPIATGETAADVAQKTFDELNELIVPIGDVALSLNIDTITFINTEYGKVQPPSGDVGFTVTPVTEGSGGDAELEDVDIVINYT